MLGRVFGLIFGQVCLRHLRIFLSFDDSIPKDKVKYCWGSDQSVSALISFALNDKIRSETGVCPSMFCLVLRMFFRFQLVLQCPENMHNVQQCSLPQGCMFIISLNSAVLSAAFNAILPNAKNTTLMHREGVAIVGCFERYLPRVLFDTGALCSSHVSRQWVDENIDLLRDCLVPVTSRVSLADNVTVVPINHVINLSLSFIKCELVEHYASLRCYVLPMPETSLIVGLPHILFEFFHLFESMLRSARSLVMSGNLSPHAGLSVLRKVFDPGTSSSSYPNSILSKPPVPVRPQVDGLEAGQVVDWSAPSDLR